MEIIISKRFFYRKKRLHECERLICRPLDFHGYYVGSGDVNVQTIRICILTNRICRKRKKEIISLTFPEEVPMSHYRLYVILHHYLFYIKSNGYKAGRYILRRYEVVTENLCHADEKKSWMSQLYIRNRRLSIPVNPIGLWVRHLVTFYCFITIFCILLGNSAMK